MIRIDFSFRATKGNILKDLTRKKKKPAKKNSIPNKIYFQKKR